MLFAAGELLQTLYAAWRAADLWRRLQAWWYVVTHQDLIDTPPTSTEVAR